MRWKRSWLTESSNIINKALDVFVKKVIGISIHAAIKKLDKEREEHPSIPCLPVSALDINKNNKFGLN
ncbi:MAG: hypothetical protein ACTS78_04250 [Arsenophonus sp. NC-WZS1-MAG3]